MKQWEDPNRYQTCSKCYQQHLLTIEFWEPISNINYKKVCRGCLSTRELEFWEDPEVLHRCSKCFEMKPRVAEFYGARKDKPSGFRVECKVCIAKRTKEKNYSKESRQRIRETIGDAAMKKRQNDAAIKYRSENPDAIVKWRKTSFITHYTNYRERGFELGKERAEELMYAPCFYCGVIDLSIHINGIDRLDSSIGYEEGNMVTACEMCNMMKRALDPVTFVLRMRQITLDVMYDDIWPLDVRPSSFNSYRTRAEKKALDFTITEQFYNEVVAELCTYCTRRPPFGCGMDRIDNDLGYTEENITPACGECNYMKKALNMDVFIVQAANIAAFCDIDKIPVTKINLYSVRKSNFGDGDDDGDIE